MFRYHHEKKREYWFFDFYIVENNWLIIITTFMFMISRSNKIIIMVEGCNFTDSGRLIEAIRIWWCWKETGEYQTQRTFTVLHILCHLLWEFHIQPWTGKGWNVTSPCFLFHIFKDAVFKIVLGWNVYIFNFNLKVWIFITEKHVFC